MKLIILLVCVLGICGCGAEYAGGVATGVALREVAEKSENDLINEINRMNSETERINTAVDGIGGTIKGLKGREKDPVTWIALGSVLANMFWGGKSFGSKKK
jgi:hypothetical protein